MRVEPSPTWPAASHSLPLGSTYGYAPPPPHSIATQLKPRPGSACVLTPFLLRSAYGLTLHPTVEPIIHSHENEKRFSTKGDFELGNHLN